MDFWIWLVGFTHFHDTVGWLMQTSWVLKWFSISKKKIVQQMLCNWHNCNIPKKKLVNACSPHFCFQWSSLNWILQWYWRLSIKGTVSELLIIVWTKLMPFHWLLVCIHNLLQKLSSGYTRPFWNNFRLKSVCEAHFFRFPKKSPCWNSSFSGIQFFKFLTIHLKLPERCRVNIHPLRNAEKVWTSKCPRVTAQNKNSLIDNRWTIAAFQIIK